MHRAQWIAKKNELYTLIKKISDLNGGDEVEWLREYAKDIVETYKDCLDEAISCFRSLDSSKGKSLSSELNIPLKTNVCVVCHRVPPFCYYSTDGVCSNK